MGALMRFEVEWSCEILVALWTLVLCRSRPLLTTAIVDADSARLCGQSRARILIRGLGAAA